MLYYLLIYYNGLIPLVNNDTESAKLCLVARNA